MDELVEHWTVLDDELELVAGKRGGTRLGFVLLLKYYTRQGRFPRGRVDFPDEVVEFVARQMKVSTADFESYQWTGSMIEYHRAQIRGHLGFRVCSVQDADETSPELLTLMSETVQAAMQTPLEEKIIALGKCLGRSVRDETTVDAEFIYVKGLAEIEATEVKVMQVFDQPTGPTPESYAQTHWPGWRRPEILGELPCFAAVLDASIARLTAAGMVRDDGIGRLPRMTAQIRRCGF
jgi:hypothetical protein